VKYPASSTVRRVIAASLTLLLMACSPDVKTQRPPSASATPSVTATHPPTDTPVRAHPTATARPLTTSTPAQNQAPTAQPDSTIEYSVAPGDTLLGLAMEYGVPMAAIQLANDLGPRTGLLAGQVLDIPPTSDWPEASPFWVLVTVSPSLTLSEIARDYGLSVEQIMAVNDTANADLLRAGQTLILPLQAPAELAHVSVPTATPMAVDTPAATATPDSAAETPEGTAPPPTVAPPTAVAPPPAGDGVAGWPGEGFRLINEVRAQNGLSPYGYNALLAQAAQLHGEDCQQRGYCDHTGSDGSNVRTRVARVGYDAAGAAECIVYASSPEQAVAWWLDEVPPDDAHRRTLLNTWVSEIGVAVVPTGRGNYYFIADFGRPN